VGRMTIFDLLTPARTLIVFVSLALNLCGKISIKTHYGWYTIGCVVFLVEAAHSHSTVWTCFQTAMTVWGVLELVEPRRRGRHQASSSGYLEEVFGHTTHGPRDLVK
jgi:hypothetical protein